MRTALGDGVGEVGGTVDEVFAVVQDEQCSARLQRGDDRFGQRPPKALLHAQHARDRPRHLARRAVSGELDEPGSAHDVDVGPFCRRQGEPRLTDPSRPHERHDREVGEGVVDDLQVRVAADQSTQSAREIPSVAVVGPQRRMVAVAELEDVLLGDDTLEAERPEVTQVGSVEQCRRHPGHQRLAAMAGGGKPSRDDQGRTEVALSPLLGLTGVQPDPNLDVDLRGPPLAAHRGLQLGGPCSRVTGAMEGDTERVTTRREDVPGVTIDCGRDEIVMASHRRSHVATVHRPQPGRVLDVGEPERHRPRRNAQRRTHRGPIDTQLLVLAEDQRLQFAEPWAGFDPEPLDEVRTGPAIRGERIGLAAHAVQRRHQQCPQPFAEGVGRRQLGQRTDHRMRVGLDAPPQVGLHHPEVLLDQPVDRRRQPVGGEPAEGSARPLSERGLGVVHAEQPLEAHDVDRSGRHVQAIGDAGPHDRVGAEALAQARHI